MSIVSPSEALSYSGGQIDSVSALSLSNDITSTPDTSLEVSTAEKTAGDTRNASDLSSEFHAPHLSELPFEERKSKYNWAPSVRSFASDSTMTSKVISVLKKVRRSKSAPKINAQSEDKVTEIKAKRRSVVSRNAELNLAWLKLQADHSLVDMINDGLRVADGPPSLLPPLSNREDFEVSHEGITEVRPFHRQSKIASSVIPASSVPTVSPSSPIVPWLKVTGTVQKSSSNESNKYNAQQRDRIMSNLPLLLISALRRCCQSCGHGLAFWIWIPTAKALCWSCIEGAVRTEESLRWQQTLYVHLDAEQLREHDPARCEVDLAALAEIAQRLSFQELTDYVQASAQVQREECISVLPVIRVSGAQDAENQERTEALFARYRYDHTVYIGKLNASFSSSKEWRIKVDPPLLCTLCPQSAEHGRGRIILSSEADKHLAEKHGEVVDDCKKPTSPIGSVANTASMRVHWPKDLEQPKSVAATRRAARRRLLPGPQTFESISHSIEQSNDKLIEENPPSPWSGPRSRLQRVDRPLFERRLHFQKPLREE